MDSDAWPDWELWQRRWTRPSNELPVVLGQSQVIGEADGVVLAVGAFRVFSNGFGFDLQVRLRGGRGPVGPRVSESMHGPRVGVEQPLAERLLLGVEFADGRRASNLGAAMPEPGADPGTPRLVTSSGGGGGQVFDFDLWLSPLPPPGPLTIVCVWPTAGVPETRTVFDGSAVAEAAGRVRTLWPWEPDRYEEALPTEPERPATGWFAEA